MGRERSERGRSPRDDGVSDTWEALVTTGLLGTDRRDPPPVPPGPVADVVDDTLDASPAGRLLTAVAATVVARRCGMVPRPPQPLLQSPPPDDRPLLPVAAARRWHGIAAYWPVLEPEWVAAATAVGWRPSADVLVAMLERSRRSPDRFAAVIEFGGPLARWLIDYLPDHLPVPSGRARSGEATATLAVPAELQAGFELTPAEFAAVVVTGITDGMFRWAHRTVLLNAIAAMPAAFLDDMISALAAGRAAHEERARAGEAPLSGAPTPLGLWESLIELATVRRDMLAELTPQLSSHHDDEEHD